MRHCGIVEELKASVAGAMAVKKGRFTEQGKNRVWGARVCGSARGVGRGCGKWV